MKHSANTCGSQASVLLLVLTIAVLSQECVGQTFHYSHGWTNGKRSGGLAQLGPNAQAAAAAAAATPVSRMARLQTESDLQYLNAQLGPLQPLEIAGPILIVPVKRGGKTDYRFFTVDPERIESSYMDEE